MFTIPAITSFYRSLISCLETAVFAHLSLNPSPAPNSHPLCRLATLYVYSCTYIVDSTMFHGEHYATLQFAPMFHVEHFPTSVPVRILFAAPSLPLACPVAV